MKNKKLDSDILDENFFPIKKTNYNFLKFLGYTFLNLLGFAIIFGVFLMMMVPLLYFNETKSVYYIANFPLLVAWLPFIYLFYRKFRYGKLWETDWQIWVTIISFFSFFAFTFFWVVKTTG